jgi:hypothetical protein
VTRRICAYILEQEVARAALVKGLDPVYRAARDIHDCRPWRAPARNELVAANVIRPDPECVERFLGAEYDRLVRSEFVEVAEFVMGHIAEETARGADVVARCTRVREGVELDISVERRVLRPREPASRDPYLAAVWKGQMSGRRQERQVWPM